MKKWVVGWGVVSSCNMRCKFCYSRNKRIKENDINPEYWYKFIEQNANLIESINYGTGENSLSGDWFKLIKFIRTKYPHITQSVTTNGYISEVVESNEEYKQIFLDSIDEVDVSLDFADEAKHNDFRGQNKAYTWAINMLKFGCENKKRLTIVSLGSDLVITKENMKVIFEIAKKYNAMVRINIYRPTNGIDDFSSKFLLSKERLIEFLKWANENYQILALNDALLSAIILEKENIDSSGVNSVRILPNGDVSPSTYLISDKFIVGNLKDEIDLKNLENLKNGRLGQIIKNVLPEKCNNCTYASLCKGGVIDRRYLWNGSLKFRDPYCFVEDKELLNKIEGITLSKEPFHSVHDGYLPTMFFKNREDDVNE